MLGDQDYVIMRLSKNQLKVRLKGYRRRLDEERKKNVGWPRANWKDWSRNYEFDTLPYQQTNHYDFSGYYSSNPASKPRTEWKTEGF